MNLLIELVTTFPHVTGFYVLMIVGLLAWDKHDKRYIDKR